MSAVLDELTLRRSATQLHDAVRRGVLAGPVADGVDRVACWTHTYLNLKPAGSAQARDYVLAASADLLRLHGSLTLLPPARQAVGLALRVADQVRGS